MLTLCLFLQFEFVDYRACFLRRCVYFLVNPPTHVPVGLQQLSLAPLPLFYTKMFSSLREKKKEKKYLFVYVWGFCVEISSRAKQIHVMLLLYTHTHTCNLPTHLHIFLCND